MRKNFIGFVIFTGFLTALQAQRLELPAQVPMLSVNGNGEVAVEPDEATVRLGITRQSPSAREAQEQANEVAQEIFNAITALGVAKDQIQTSTLTLYPVYAPHRPERAEEPRIVAYRASNVISVRLEKLTLVGPVIDAGLQAGANQLEGVQFGLKNDLEARKQALTSAVAEARQKAETMAGALNLRLVQVMEVTEGGVSIVRPMFAQREVAMAAVARDVATPVSPGQVRIHANVTIRYRIDGK